jgi:aldehyde dehydrogenase (NAD+)
LKSLDHFYIDGRFIPSRDRPQRIVINPATEEPAGSIAMGAAEDVNAAVIAARKAFARIRQMKHKSVEPEARFSYYSQ